MHDTPNTRGNHSVFKRLVTHLLAFGRAIMAITIVSLRAEAFTNIEKRPGRWDSDQRPTAGVVSRLTMILYRRSDRFLYSILQDTVNDSVRALINIYYFSPTMPPSNNISNLRLSLSPYHGTSGLPQPCKLGLVANPHVLRFCSISKSPGLQLVFPSPRGSL